MKTILALILFLVGIADAAISAATKPHTIDSAATPKVSYVDDNDEALLDKLNEVIDTANTYLGGGVSAAVLSTTGDQRLTIDSDNNGSNRWFVTSGGASDTLLRILEGGAWATYGAGTGTKLTLSDSILAATARISGLTASRLMATNAGSTLASVADLTAWVAGTANQITATSDGDGSLTLSIPNGFTLPSASPTFTGLTLTGNQTVGGTFGVAGVSKFGTGTLTFGTKNLSVIGASFDGTSIQFENTDVNTVANGRAFNFGITDVSGTNGRLDLTQPGERTVFSVFSNGNVGWGSTTDGGEGFQVAGTSRFAGAVTVSTNFTQSAGTHTVSVTDNTADAVDIQQGSNNYINLTTANGAEVLAFGNASTNPAIQLLGTGAKSIDGAITASSTGTWTGKLGTADSLYAEDGLRVGSVSASNVNWNRSGANMWHTPDSVTVAGRLAVSDSISTGGNEKFAHDYGFFVGTMQGLSTAPTPICRYSTIASIVNVQCEFGTGTSDSTGFSITGVPSAILPTNGGGFAPISHATNNGSVITNVSVYVDNNENAFRFAVDGNPIGWTASGTKGLPNNVFFSYLIR